MNDKVWYLSAFERGPIYRSLERDWSANRVRAEHGVATRSAVQSGSVQRS